MKRAGELALLALQGLWLSALWLNDVAWQRYPTRTLAMIAGTEARPYAYRVLAPLVARGLIAAGLPWLSAAGLIVVVSFVGWLWALRWLAESVMPSARPMLATVLAAGPVGLLFVAGGYLYDPPTLALFTLCLALLASGRHELLYAVVFVLMCFCRETAILLPLVALAWRGRRDWRNAFTQLAHFVLVRLVVMSVFFASPGSTLETHWTEHLAWLWQYPLPNVLALSVYGAAVAVSLWKWQTQPAFLRAAGLVVPAIFAAYWLVGFPGEIRVCLEAYPVLCLLTWHAVHRVLRRRPWLPVFQAFGKQTARLS